MTAHSRWALFWAPRALCIAFSVFVSLFALDVFGEGHGLWQTLVGLALHLIPTFTMVAVLAVAWRWEWFGAVGFAAAGIFFLVVARPTPLSFPIVGHWLGKVMFAAPTFVMAGLFLANWLKRTELRARP